MKLLDIPKHPWIVHHSGGKSLNLLEAALSSIASAQEELKKTNGI